MFYFNESVRKIKIKGNSKFTKENFLYGFCKKDRLGIDTLKRIADILKLS